MGGRKLSTDNPPVSGTSSRGESEIQERKDAPRATSKESEGLTDKFGPSERRL